MTQEPTTPNIARIYDYWLGGTHNFAIDRKVGEQAAKSLPFVMQSLRLNRWFLSYAGRQLAQAGLEQYIDLGAGLPTEGALHQALPDSAKILYNDYDPETIAYARQILGDRPNIAYIQAKIEDIETILAAAEQFFGSNRRVGICLIGVAYFIEDNALKHVFQQLYDWCAPGSMLAISSNTFDPSDSKQVEVIATYERNTGIKIYLRPADHLLSLTGSWQPRDGGLLPFEHYAETELGTSIVEPPFRGKVGYAGFLQKR